MQDQLFSYTIQEDLVLEFVTEPRIMKSPSSTRFRIEFLKLRVWGLSGIHTPNPDPYCYTGRHESKSKVMTS